MANPLTRDVIAALSRAATAAHPREACGILTGHEGRITGFIEARNVHPSPESHFEIDPQALIDAHRAARDGGPAVLGYFHSHPVGPARPSKTDEAMAAKDGMIWAIAGREAGTAELGIYCSVKSGFEWLCTHALDV